MALGELFGDEVEKLAREIDVVEGHPRDAELLAQDLGHLGFGHEALLDQDLSEPSPSFFWMASACSSWAAADDVGRYEKLAQADATGHGSAHPNMRLECRVSPSGQPECLPLSP